MKQWVVKKLKVCDKVIFFYDFNIEKKTSNIFLI